MSEFAVNITFICFGASNIMSNELGNIGCNRKHNGKTHGLNSVALPERVSQGAKIWARLSISNYIGNCGRILNE